MSRKLQQAVPRLDAIRVLRCPETHRYFTGNGWSDDPAQAERFPNPLEAIRTCLVHEMESVELVLWAAETHAELFSTRLR